MTAEQRIPGFAKRVPSSPATHINSPPRLQQEAYGLAVHL
jgi:hypothetical protein